MGLFSRRAKTELELAAMRAALDELRAELWRNDADAAALRNDLSAARADLAERSQASETSVREQLSAAQAERARLNDLVAALRSEIAHTRAGLGAVETRLAPAVDDLDERLRAIDERLSTPMTPPPSTPPPGPDPNTSEVKALSTHLARLDERLAAVDRRVTVVSTELANQLAEISSDIETLDHAVHNGEGRQDGASVLALDDDLLEQLRDAQARLANEQVRYQIAFRDDLARLAEQLKRR
jgi:chromosome segregation ATPase